MPADRLDEKAIETAARHVGRDWKQSSYYETAEKAMEKQWQEMIWPFLTADDTRLDFSVVAELAAGHGRNSAKLLPLTDELHLIDINEENIEFLRTRFSADSRVHFHETDGYSLPFFSGNSVTLVYCFDAMVHFDSDVVRSYLQEISRILRPGGHAFIHHSNFTGNPGGDVHANIAWRNFMSRELFAHYAIKERLTVVRQKLIDWTWDKRFIDCFTLLGS
jgi:SAM-dependent methyltransferase